MPARDIFHDAVRHALEKDGWTITNDPFTLDYKGIRLYADLGAEKVIAAEKENQTIIVEIKVFNSPSLITELEKTIGQYNVYRSLIKRIEPKRILHLAITEDVYKDFFCLEPIQEIVNDQDINLIIFNPELEVIIQWISSINIDKF